MYDLSFITSDARLRPPRIILLGVEKIGKSTFASQSDRPIMMPIKGEEGIDDIAVPKIPEPCRSVSDLFGWLANLANEEHNYGTAVIDSTSALEPLVWEETCRLNGGADSIEKVGGGYGKGYTAALDTWRLMTEWLDLLRKERNMASILVGHVKVKRFDDPTGPSFDTYTWDINEKAASLLYRWSDAVLFCNTKVVVQNEDVGFNKELHKAIDITGGQRFLFTQKRPAHPGGGRGAFGRLPYELPLNFAAYMDAVAAAAAAQTPAGDMLANPPRLP